VISADWKQLKFHGDRVRELFVGSGDFWVSSDMLYYNTPGETKIDPTVFRALSRMDALLPNLLRLRWWECRGQTRQCSSLSGPEACIIRD
jgi:hypothetical protein